MAQRQGPAARANRVQGEEGATAVEYALFMALIAAVIAAIVMTLGKDVLEMFESVDWW